MSSPLTILRDHPEIGICIIANSAILILAIRLILRAAMFRRKWLWAAFCLLCPAFSLFRSTAYPLFDQQGLFDIPVTWTYGASIPVAPLLAILIWLWRTDPARTEAAN